MTLQIAFKSFAQGISLHPNFKLLVSLFTGAVGYILPGPGEATIFAFTGLLLFIDTTTGIVAAWVKNEPIDPMKMRRIVGKIIGYAAVVIVVGGVVKVMEFPQAWASGARAFVLGSLLSIEALSVVKNVYRMGILPRKLYKSIAKVLEGAVPKEPDDPEASPQE